MTTMAAKVAVLESPNFVVAVRLAVARLPPGADVVSMIAYVLFNTSCGNTQVRDKRR